MNKVAFKCKAVLSVFVAEKCALTSVYSTETIPSNMSARSGRIWAFETALRFKVVKKCFKVNS